MMIPLLITLLAIFKCPIVFLSVNAQSTVCRAFGIDFSQLADYELSGVKISNTGALNTGEFFVGRVCGTIQDHVPCRGYMMCQRYNSCGSTQVVADWDHTVAIWYRNEPSASGEGYSYTLSIQSGALCNGVSRKGVFLFKCDRTAAVPYATTVTEDPQCTYTMTVYTSIVCSAAPQLKPVSPNCNFGGFDFSSLAQAEIQGPNVENADMHFRMRICGVTDDKGCPLGSSASNRDQASICIHSDSCNPYKSVSVGAIWDNSGQWSWINSDDYTEGVQIVFTNGESCNGGTRRVTIQFLCDPDFPYIPTTGTFVEVNCEYEILIYTDKVCQPGYTKPTIPCKFLGYDFSPLESYDIIAPHAATAAYWYALRVCGVVNTSYCNSDNIGRHSMFCQMYNSGSGVNAVAAWAPPPLSKWSYINDDWQQGVQMSIKDGSPCGAVGQRMGIVRFLCAPNAVKPVFGVVKETSTCVYEFTLYTYIVCNPPNTSLPGDPVIAPQYNNPVAQSGRTPPHGAYGEGVKPCNGLGYDLSTLSQYTIRAKDMKNSNYWYAFRICGVVNDDHCIWSPVANNLSMFCQHASPQNLFYAYSLSEWPEIEGINSNILTWNWVNGQDYAQGMLMTLPDGDWCAASDTNRTSRAQFVCDPLATVPVSEGVFEYPVCTYTIIIRTELLCRPPTGDMVADPSNSAISASVKTAAIIVPIVVFLIITTLCCVFILSKPGFAKSSKAPSSESAATFGVHSPQAESSQVSNVEMEASQVTAERETAV